MPHRLAPRPGAAGIGPRPAEPVAPAGLVVARGDEPGMLAGAVVHDEIDDHADTARVRRVQEGLEIGRRPVVRLDARVVGDVVAVVAGRGADRHQPDTGDPQVVVRGGVAVVQVVQTLGQTPQVADAVTVAVLEAAHEDLVEDGIVPPVQLGSLRASAVAAATGLADVVAHVDQVRAVDDGVRAVVADAGELLGAVPLAVDAELVLEIVARHETRHDDRVDRVAIGIGQRGQGGAPAVEAAGHVDEIGDRMELARQHRRAHVDPEGDVDGRGGRGDRQQGHGGQDDLRQERSEQRRPRQRGQGTRQRSHEGAPFRDPGCEGRGSRGFLQRR